MKKLTHGQPEGPVSIRMSAELQKQLDFCADQTGMKVTDPMKRIKPSHIRFLDDSPESVVITTIIKGRHVARWSRIQYILPNGTTGHWFQPYKPVRHEIDIGWTRARHSIARKLNRA